MQQGHDSYIGPTCLPRVTLIITIIIIIIILNLKEVIQYFLKVNKGMNKPPGSFEGVTCWVDARARRQDCIQFWGGVFFSTGMAS